MFCPTCHHNPCKADIGHGSHWPGTCDLAWESNPGPNKNRHVNIMIHKITQPPPCGICPTDDGQWPDRSNDGRQPDRSKKLIAQVEQI
eukprot:CCRYP_008817-RA/>CCRYP_008817-RA protein AED:0.26 eAED:0.26 QI:7/1/1/1/0/0/2/109/87